MQASIEPLVLEEYQSEVCGDPPLPPHQVHVCFVFFENIIFHPCSIYFSDSFYYMKLTYVTLCRLLVRLRCLKSPKLVTHLWKSSRYVHVHHFLSILILMIQHVLFNVLKFSNCILVLLYVGTWFWWCYPTSELLL